MVFVQEMQTTLGMLANKATLPFQHGFVWSVRQDIEATCYTIMETWACSPSHNVKNRKQLKSVNRGIKLCPWFWKVKKYEENLIRSQVMCHIMVGKYPGTNTMFNLLFFLKKPEMRVKSYFFPVLT